VQACDLRFTGSGNSSVLVDDAAENSVPGALGGMTVAGSWLGGRWPRTTPDDAVCHIVSIMDTRRRPGRVTITKQALWVRRHQRATGK
jgi:hypothetical protein